MIALYSNNKGVVLFKKYCFGFDGKFEYRKVMSSDVFYIHFLMFHFYYLKK